MSATTGTHRRSSSRATRPGVALQRTRDALAGTDEVLTEINRARDAAAAAAAVAWLDQEENWCRVSVRSNHSRPMIEVRDIDCTWISEDGEHEDHFLLFGCARWPEPHALHDLDGPWRTDSGGAL